jgi:hypothetical protein
LFFWAILGLAVVYRAGVSVWREQGLAGMAIDLLGLALIFFLIDMVVKSVQKRRRKDS